MADSTALVATRPQPDLVQRYRDATHYALDQAAKEDVAGNYQRWVQAAGVATDKMLVLSGQPSAVVQHVHTVDLGALAAGFAEVARRLHPAKDVPTTIDARFVPLDLARDMQGAVGQAGDVGFGSGVPRPQAQGPKIAAPRQKRGPRGAYGRRKTSTTIDVPGKELNGARHRMRIRAAKLAAKAKANGTPQPE